MAEIKEREGPLIAAQQYPLHLKLRHDRPQTHRHSPGIPPVLQHCRSGSLEKQCAPLGRGIAGHSKP